MGPPNDEARDQHPLQGAGLHDILWVGLVRDSTLVSQMRPMWARVGGDGGTTLQIMPLHYVVLSKECVVEVLAENVDGLRVAGTTRQAASASLSP